MGSQGHEDGPTVTVIVNVYNGESYVEATLASLAAQTYRDFQCLIWDNASTDATPELVQAFCDRDDRFTLERGEENIGLVPARNAAIQMATGEWIAICDADDLWLPKKLERQCEAIRRHDGRDPPLVAIGARGVHINPEGKVRGFFDAGLNTVEEYDRARATGEVLYLLASSVVFRKDVHQVLGGFRMEYYPAEDIDHWTRLGDHGLVYSLEDVLVRYRVHGASLTDRSFVKMVVNTERMAENARRRLRGEAELSHEEFFVQMRRDPKVFRRHVRRWTARGLYRSAGAALANGDYRAGIAFLGRSLIVDPHVPARRLRSQVLRGDLIAGLARSR